MTVALRRGSAAGAALLALLAAPAWGAFAATVQTTATSFGAYVVQVPGGIACSGLGSPLNSKLVWNAVPPPPGNSVDYVVTAPGGATSATAATNYQLPSVTLSPGQYSVQARISSGWLSQATTITVGLTVLGLFYTCSTP
ncbi:MAG: hypothetical protein WBC33_03735 [Conexibacter sp.]